MMNILLSVLNKCADLFLFARHLWAKTPQIINTNEFKIIKEIWEKKKTQMQLNYILTAFFLYPLQVSLSEAVIWRMCEHTEVQQW